MTPPEPPIAAHGPPPLGSPYCSHCGFSLEGLTDASRCPECGRPLVEVLARDGQPNPVSFGRRYDSPIRLLGYPILSIASGPRPDLGEKRGVARGWIAIGDIAIGGIALGGVSIGVVGAGGLAVGGVVFGGLAAGTLGGVGGLATGALAAGGAAVGGLAVGGMAIGYGAMGGMAIGAYGWGGQVAAAHAVTHTARDPEADRFFDQTSWFFGTPTSHRMQPDMVHPPAIVAAVGASLALVILVLVALARAKHRGPSNPFQHQPASHHRGD